MDINPAVNKGACVRSERVWPTLHSFAETMAEQVPQTTPLPELAAACRRETLRFRREGVSESRFCLEIFRRALLTAAGSEAQGRSSPVYLDEAARDLLVIDLH